MRDHTSNDNSTTTRSALHQYGCAIFDAMWRPILPLVVVVLLWAFLTLPQTQEFFREWLFVCESEPGRCGQDLGVQASALQFVALALVSMALSLTVWHVASVLTDRQGRPATPENLIDARFAAWGPILLGLAPVTLVSLTVLQRVDSFWSNPPLLFALLCTACLVLTPLVLRIRFPARFSARQMFTCLFAGVFSIVLCTLRPHHPGAEKLWLVLPWMLVLLSYGWIAAKAYPVKWWRVGLIVLIELVTGTIFVTIDTATGGSTFRMRWTWTVPVAMLTPALYLALMVGYRYLGWQPTFEQWCAKVANEQKIAIRLNRCAPGLHWRSVVIWLICSLAGLSLGYVVMLDPLAWSMVFSMPSAAVLWLTIALPLAAVLLYVVPLRVRVALIATWGLLFYAGEIPPMALKSNEAELPADTCGAMGVCTAEQMIPVRYRAWKQAHGGDADEGPIILVAAAGGGARAAAHTSARLAAADAGSCGLFGDRVFAISAVSGGALGAATYVAARRDLDKPAPDRGACLRAKAEERPAPLMTQLTRVAAADHLSATVIRALFRDLPVSALPAMLRGAPRPDDDDSRAGTLRQSWASHYRDMLANTLPHREAGAQPQVPSSLETGLEATAPGGAPLMLFNGTSVQDGRRIVMSSPLLCPRDGYCASSGGDLLTDGIDSARFPLVSPARNIDLYGWNGFRKLNVMARRSVVDGGYLDNSGIVTLMDVIDGLLAARVKAERIVVVLISSNPLEGEPPSSTHDWADLGVKSTLLGPIEGLVNARDGRTEFVLEAMKRRLDVGNVIHWSLSENSLNTMVPQVAASMQKSPKQIAYEQLHGGARSERELRHAPPLGWALSRDSANFIWHTALETSRAYADPKWAKYQAERILSAKLHAPHRP